MVAVAALVAALSLHNRGGQAEEPGALLSVTETISVGTGQPAGRVEDMAVFSIRQAPRDVLPPPLVAASARLAKPEPTGVGGWRGNESRRIAGSGGVTFYAWPVGKRGLCAGIVTAGGHAADCTPGGPGPNDAYVANLNTAGFGKRVFAGVVGKNVAHVEVDAPGLACSVHAARSGFVCAGGQLDRTMQI